MVERITTFLHESNIELRKVTWPTREETIRYTVTVIVIIGIVALFLGGMDYIFGFMLNNLI